MNAVLTVAFPVFAVIAAGFAAGRLALAGAEDSAALNRFVFRFGFPAALFALMSGASGMTAKDARAALAYGVSALAVMALYYVLARNIFRAAPEDAGAHAFASVIRNAVFLGLPIALGVEGWARPFMTLMLVEGILIVAVGAAIMSPRGGAMKPFADRARALVLRPLSNPLVAAAIAGFLFASLGLTLPGPVRSAFELVGRAAGPVALFSLGLFFATRAMPPFSQTLGRALTIAVMKMLALPALSLFALSAFGVADPAYRGALALFTCVPTAVAAFVMASQNRRYVDETAAAIAVTTALSILSIGVVLIVFA